jgi:hypothetical protein
MRFGAVATMTVLVAAGFVASTTSCGNLIETRSGSGGSNGGASTTTSASGGKASGGTTTTPSGAGGAGGVVSAGGTTAKGGAGGSGGAAGAGGEGGEAGAGGSNQGGSGGISPKGGSGGAAGVGGTVASGGNTAKGGTTGAGGIAGSGGATAKGGSGGATTTTTTVSNCTDDPPPDQDPTCAEWNSYGMCSQSWFANYCNRTCGRCTGSNGGAGGAGGSSARGGSGGGAGGVAGSGGTTAKGGSGGGGGVVGPGSTNPQITGTNGWASRYWDCCKPSCGWTANSNPPVPSCQKDGMTRTSAEAKNGCEGGGTAYECYDFSPWYDSGTNMSYGFVAYNGVPCGTCFMIQFNGNGNSGPNDGAAKLKGQQMVVQVINIGGIQANQFDLLVPGGGVGAMTAGCTAQWGNVDLGVTYGGLLSECGGDCACMKGKCQSIFGNMASAIKNGCDWFTGWYSCADNPQLVYKQVSCPSQLTSKTGIQK